MQFDTIRWYFFVKISTLTDAMSRIIAQNFTKLLAETSSGFSITLDWNNSFFSLKRLLSKINEK